MLRIFKQYYPIRNAIFVLGEGSIIFLSVLIAYGVILGQKSPHIEVSTAIKALLITALCQVCLYYNDLYDLEKTDNLVELSIRLLQALGVASIILAVIYFVFPNIIIHQGLFLIAIIIIIVFITSWRIAYNQILKRGLFDTALIILGSSDIGKEIFNEVNNRKDSGYRIVAVVSQDNWPDTCDSKDIDFVCQHSFENLCEIAQTLQTKKIVVSLKQRRNALPIKELLKCRVNGIDVIEGSTFYEMLMGKLIVEEINPGWLIFSQGFKKSRTRRFIKRSLDMIFSLTMLIVLLPFILLVAAAIKLDSKGPILFSQERVGQNRKPFLMYKFRSMRTDAENETGPVWAQNNDARITRIGHLMRKWRIDEIPQLWNVLNGEMSFVGPRPERDHFVKQLIEIIPYYGERFTVKPGLTGWAQVSYGYGASVDDAIEKLNYDLFYIKNMSVLMDIMIVAKSVKTVLFGHGR